MDKILKKIKAHHYLGLSFAWMAKSNEVTETRAGDAIALHYRRLAREHLDSAIRLRKIYRALKYGWHDAGDCGGITERRPVR